MNCVYIYNYINYIYIHIHKVDECLCVCACFCMWNFQVEMKCWHKVLENSPKKIFSPPFDWCLVISCPIIPAPTWCWAKTYRPKLGASRILSVGIFLLLTLWPPGDWRSAVSSLLPKPHEDEDSATQKSEQIFGCDVNCRFMNHGACIGGSIFQQKIINIAGCPSLESALINHLGPTQLRIQDHWKPIMDMTWPSFGILRKTHHEFEYTPSIVCPLFWISHGIYFFRTSPNLFLGAATEWRVRKKKTNWWHERKTSPEALNMGSLKKLTDLGRGVLTILWDSGTRRIGKAPSPWPWRLLWGFPWRRPQF
jgi:hypothetical protein